MNAEQTMDIDSRLQLEAWASENRLFALVDPFFEVGTKCPRRKLELKDTDPVFFEMIAWDQVTYTPPTLFQVDVETTRLILNTFSTDRWGLFLVAPLDLETLARHLQKFVIARGPDGNPYFLRFHDPSVLEVLLRSWDEKTKAIFSGPVQAFGLPELDSMDVQLYMLSKRFKEGLPNPEECLIQLETEQLKQCAEAIERDLVKVIYWYIRNFHAKAVQFVERTKLEFRIGVAISRARTYNLNTVSDLAGYAALMFELAPNFDEHPSFRGVLEDRRVAPEVKLKRLAQVITDREWDEAVRMYDRTYWQKAEIAHQTRVRGRRS